MTACGRFGKSSRRSTPSGWRPRACPATSTPRRAPSVRLTLFSEGQEGAKRLKVGQKVTLAPAGADRKPTTSPVSGTLTEVKAGRLSKVAVTLDAAAAGFEKAGLARLWGPR